MNSHFARVGLDPRCQGGCLGRLAWLVESAISRIERVPNDFDWVGNQNTQRGYRS